MEPAAAFIASEDDDIRVNSFGEFKDLLPIPDVAWRCARTPPVWFRERAASGQRRLEVSLHDARSCCVPTWAAVVTAGLASPNVSTICTLPMDAACCARISDTRTSWPA